MVLSSQTFRLTALLTLFLNSFSNKWFQIDPNLGSKFHKCPYRSSITRSNQFWGTWYPLKMIKTFSFVNIHSFYFTRLISKFLFHQKFNNFCPQYVSEMDNFWVGSLSSQFRCVRKSQNFKLNLSQNDHGPTVFQVVRLSSTFLSFSLFLFLNYFSGKVWLN